MNGGREHGPHRAGDVSADDAERLLSGGRASEGTESLAEVLAVVARLEPSTCGYENARRAFLDAGRAQTGHRSSALSVGRIAAVKIIAIAVVLFMAGTAAAAEADALPGPIQRVVHNVFSVVGVPAPKPAIEPDGTGATKSVSIPEPMSTPVPAPSGRPSASITARAATETSEGDSADALCAKVARGGVKKLVASDHHKLAVLAGGDQNISAYCAQAVSRAVTSTPHAVAPSPTGSTKSHPGRAPETPDANGRGHDPGKKSSG